ncbi:MAG: hypothetical protein AAFX04_00270 [Pseudomonadota bacterium]
MTTENWIVIGIAALLVLILIWWLVSRPGRDHISEGGARPFEDGDDQALEDMTEEVASVLTRDRKETVALNKDLEQARDELRIDKQPAARANPIAQMPAPAPAAAEPTDNSKPNIAAATGEPDDLSKIKGIGPKLNTLLGSLGVSRYDQIAAWTEADTAEVDGYLGNFKGRITRDNWVDQARYLAKDDIAGFEAKYGKI